MDASGGLNAFDGLSVRMRLSAVTIRNAFSRKPITFRTARILSRGLNIPIQCFSVKEDNRGKKNAKA